MLNPTEARKALSRKRGGLDGVYYAAGVEVPPRHGSVFSMRYTTVSSARAGAKLLRQKLQKKRVGMVGEVIVANQAGDSVSLGGYIRRANSQLEAFVGDIKRGALIRRRTAEAGAPR